MNHTPGPWFVSDSGTYIRAGSTKGWNICTFNGAGVHGGDSDDEIQANARLIAAAPELLSDSRDTLILFRRLLKNLEYIPDTDQSDHPHGYSVGQIPEWEIRQKIEWLEQSIAKAEGKVVIAPTSQSQ